MINKKQTTIAFAILSLTALSTRAEEPITKDLHAGCPFMPALTAPASIDDCPLMGANDHRAEVDKRGDIAMGFSHEKTTHHFRLLADGGAIEVEANDPADLERRSAIRKHLAQIAPMFAVGDFAIPVQVHAVKPPGASTMEQLKEKIRYSYEDTTKGGRVLLTTSDPEALKAIHEFMRFQIVEHRTGDTAEIAK